ncbi:hypothetical protein [Kutzneria kofuensis]
MGVGDGLALVVRAVDEQVDELLGGLLLPVDGLGVYTWSELVDMVCSC